MYDLLIKDGLIVDGSGKSAYLGDVALKDGKIAAIGELESAQAFKLIDARGLVVTPGFIDVHSHNDLVPFAADELQTLKLGQGVTTELVGQCGLGVFPCRQNTLWKDYIKGVVGDPEGEIAFADFADYRAKIEAKGLKNNYAALISHGAVRASVMGFAPREAKEEELTLMCELVEAALQQGALGLSLGLQYMPGIYSGQDELIALAKTVQEYEGIMMVHLRNHDRKILQALNEVIEVAAQTGVRIHISHLRSYASEVWGCSAEKLIAAVDDAAMRGIEISFDEHLYLSGSTLLTQLLPPWLTDKGSAAMRQMLQEEEQIARIKRELTDATLDFRGWDNYSAVAGWEGIILTSLSKRQNLEHIGKSVAELAAESKLHPVDCVAKLLLEEAGGVGIVTRNIFSEADTIKLIRHPRQMMGSDSIPAGAPHPRLYGNYPLLIGKFVREKTALSLENAVHKATLLPAKTLGLKDRGELVCGKAADLTVFDFASITGYEDYADSSKKPVGIRHVIINGMLAFEDGRCSGEKNGRMLYA